LLGAVNIYILANSKVLWRSKRMSVQK